MAVEDRHRVLAAIQVHLREVPDGAADPDQLLTAPELRDPGAVRASSTALLSYRSSFSDGGSVSRNRSLTRSEPSGSVHERTSWRSSNRDSSTLPPADVHREAAPHRQVVDGAEEPEPRLVVAVDRLQRHAQPVRAGDQFLPVGGVADRRGRHRDDPLGARPLGHRHEVPEGLHRALDRVGTELVGVAEVPCEPKGRSRVLEHVEVLALTEPEDDHPSRVRADVDHGERAGRRGRVAGRHSPPMLAYTRETGGRPRGERERNACRR